MPSLLYYLHRAREQSFRETLNQARSLAAGRARAALQPMYDRWFRSDPSKEDVLKQSGFGSAAELAHALKTRQWPELLWRSDGVTGEADQVSLRSWHTDFNSGYVWDSSTHYSRVPLSPSPGADIRMVWEWSRCHQFVILGQAYRLTKNERYAQQFTTQLLDWIRQNPCRYGVNWASPMEAGIRAINWLWAFSLMRTSAAVDDNFVLEFLTSMNTHAEFIRSNLEYREAYVHGRRRRLNSNHYLCDLAGLLSIGLLVPELRLAGDSEFAERELEIELFEQTTADGVDYEHSTSYHRFVLEIFQYSFRLMETFGRETNPRAEERLRRMNEFLAACRHPDGTLPQIGDNDSGRLLPGLEIEGSSVSGQSSAFRDAGFYVMRGADSHVVISAARPGMEGLGSHSHNDLLSFEYWWDGQAWVVDPGTFAYLGDREARNWFRSTAAHNTVRVDREEINPYHPEAIFQMVDRAGVEVLAWETGELRDLLEAAHTGYVMTNSVRHRRRFELEKRSGRLSIHDRLQGSGTHTFEWFFQIHPDVHVERLDAGFLLGARGHRVRLQMNCGDCKLTSIPGWYSPAYGVRQPATTIVAAVSSIVPLEATTVIEPC